MTIEEQVQWYIEDLAYVPPERQDERLRMHFCRLIRSIAIARLEAAEEMRERIAQYVQSQCNHGGELDCPYPKLSLAIRALPLDADEKDGGA